jgi:hypothetical protein
MGYEMKRARLNCDAKAIAEGLVKLMGEEDPNNVALIRFGMLPAKWMDRVKKSCEELLVDKLHVDPNGDSDMVLFRDVDEQGECLVRVHPKRIVSEMLHEISLALYGCVEMVV